MKLDDVTYPDCVRVVPSWDALQRTPFTPRQNVVLMRRKLEGDFNGLAQAMWELGDDSSASFVTLNSLNGVRCTKREATSAFQEKSKGFSDDMLRAVHIVQDDINTLIKSGYQCALRLENRNDDPSRVFRIHLDGPLRELTTATTVLKSRILTNYTEPTTQGWSTEDVNIIREGHILRAEPLKGVKSFRMRVGDVWKHALCGDYPEIPPFAHAGETSSKPRLLLVADRFGGP